jgi:uncharacterized protein (TIGR00106 family)
LRILDLDKNHSVIAEFSIIPIGHSESSVGRYVAAAVNAFKNIKGLDFEVTPMGTVLGAKDLNTIFEAVGQAHEAVMAKGIKRVVSTLRIDDRRDKQRLMEDKVKALREYMKQA